MGRVSQPVLPLLPAAARSVGPSAGLLEGPDGGVVFVFGLATFTYPDGDEIGRRLAAVQLSNTKVASTVEVAAAFGVTTVTLWRWGQAFGQGGVAGLGRGRTGPKGPIKLTGALAARIAGFDRQGLSLRQIAARTEVSTATVRVALGRVTPAVAAGPDQAPDADNGPAIDDRNVDPDADAGGADDGAALVVLAPPAARTDERAAARAGQLLEAPVVITQGAQLPLAGLLLCLPALAMTGLLETAGQVFPPMRRGFYGLRTTLLMGVFLALVREPRAEGASRIRPADLGRLLGLDRAPEVKTLRRKLAELAGWGRGAQLQAALGRRHAETRPEAVGFLYLDGHVRVYTGTRELPKTHIARMRIAGPATEESWVCDTDGDPVMVLTAAPSASLAAELRRLLPELRAVIGAERRCTVTFDRGGYSPQVFVEIIAAGFDLLTYYKGTWTRSEPDAFSAVEFTGPDGDEQHYQLAERPIDLPVPAVPAGPGLIARPAHTLTLRLIVRRSPDGHQTPILTSRADLPAAEICYRMSARWRQENYFRYGRQHFALDAPGKLRRPRRRPDPAGAQPGQGPRPERRRRRPHPAGRRQRRPGRRDRHRRRPSRPARQPRESRRRPGCRPGRCRRENPARPSQHRLPQHPQPPTPGPGPARQPETRNRTQTAHPCHSDERLQRRKRPGPTTTTALCPQRRRRPRPAP